MAAVEAEIPKDVLQDLCSRFLINIPDNEKNDMVRICFQIEQAHWYYIDFCRQEDPDLPPCGMKPFMNTIFSQFNFLNKTKQSVQTIYEEWRKYKIRVPVFGAILLDETLERCLLVQGFHKKASWGFPKGKVNKDEEGLKCAIREVLEEVGYDMTPLAREDDFIENNFHDHQVRLYIAPGASVHFDFKPKTRGEIKEIRWFNVNTLPAHKRDTKPKEIGYSSNNFFMIHPFVKPLRKWIADKKEKMSSMKFVDPFKMLSPMDLLSSASPKSEERREQLKKKRKEQQDQFCHKHELMNPLRSNTENENVLKAMLGMTGKEAKRSSEMQPEAIRKLLSGTLDDRSPQVQLQPITPKQNKGKRSPAQYGSHQKKKDELNHSPSSPFAMTGINILQRNDAPSAAFQTTASSKLVYTASTSTALASYKPLSSKKQNKNKNSSSVVLSDFHFSSPVFTNFRFDRQQILSVF